MEIFPPVEANLSGERFRVTYHVLGNEAEALSKTKAICLEQTVEISESMLPDGDIRDQVVGRIESFKFLRPGVFETVISYAIELSAFELVELLNVVYGNTSMKRGVRVAYAEMPDALLKAFPGPQFGREGIRKVIGAPKRPLLGTALKPVGFPAEKLADFAYQFALGGLDVIKDDHGLMDQPFARFRDRAQQCAEAVQRANSLTGGNSLYVPNITGPADQILDKAIYAREMGAGGIEICPGLVGFDMIRLLSQDDRLQLPIFAHPSMLGTYTIEQGQGLSYEFLFGQVMRLAGADGVIFAGYGGRFPTTEDDCRNLARGASRPMGHLKPILPMPGGGMTVERVPELLDVYGHEVILLISGGLFSIGPDLVENCRHFRRLVEDISE